MSRLTDDAAARPLLEVILGFAGALLVIPLILRVLGGIMRTGLFRRLATEALLVGAATLLTRDEVMDRFLPRSKPAPRSAAGVARQSTTGTE